MNTLSATDLRIGNLVYIDNELLPETANKAFTVLGIEGRNDKDFPNSDSVVRLNRDGSWVHYAQYIEFVRPIPLTEVTELLLKAGFIVGKNVHYWKPCDVEDHYLELIYSDGYYYPAWVTIPELSCENEQRSTTNRIQYLHQLQNLWKELTGNELMFKEK